MLVDITLNQKRLDTVLFYQQQHQEQHFIVLFVEYQGRSISRSTCYFIM